MDRVSANVFRYIRRVTYAECTLGNHIYHARYLDLLEAARGEFFRQLGLPPYGHHELEIRAEGRPS